VRLLEHELKSRGYSVFDRISQYDSWSENGRAVFERRTRPLDKVDPHFRRCSMRAIVLRPRENAPALNRGMIVLADRYVASNCPPDGARAAEKAVGISFLDWKLEYGIYDLPAKTWCLPSRTPREAPITRGQKAVAFVHGCQRTSGSGIRHLEDAADMYDSLSAIAVGDDSVL